MALSGIQIFKLLPKKNCKECGCPTCMAFSMKVAQGALKIEQCPHVSSEALEALSEAGVTIGNFFSNDLMTAYGRRQQNKRAEAERIAKEQRIQAERMCEENMTDAEWQKELQRREQVKAERRTYGENLRSATHSAGRSRAAIVADLESGGNWLDSL